MATFTVKKLANPLAVTAVLQTFYTVPAATTTILQGIDICNVDNVARTVRVHLVPSGGVAGTDNAIMYDLNVPVGSTISWTGPQVLSTGDFIRVVGSSTGLTLHGSGTEVT